MVKREELGMGEEKLEKEALVKGVPTGQALDIEIPPPRPKRKPSNPYPRKPGTGAPTSHVESKDGKLSTLVSSLCPDEDVLDLEKEPLSKKPGDDETQGNTIENRDENCSEVFTLFQETTCTSLSSANKNSLPPLAPSNLCNLREFVPILKEAINQDETNESHLSIGPNGNQAFQGNDAGTISNSGNSRPSHEKLVRGKKMDDLNQPENFSSFSTIDMQAIQNYPRHVPVHILDVSPGMSPQSVSQDLSHQESIFQQMRKVDGQPNLLTNPAASATTENDRNASRSPIHPSFPSFHPLFNPIPNNQDDYRSYLHISSMFSNFIVSTLLQNPAAHAAASFAATFWPYANVENSADSPAGAAGGFPSRKINSAPSMAAIAVATVAAASSWWAAHGLLPLCPPFHPGFACTPPSATACERQMDKSQARAANIKRREDTSDPALQGSHLDPVYNEALQEYSASKLPMSLSDSEESEDAKPHTGFTAADTEQAATTTELHDSNMMKSRIQVGRSSCGSNTPSSSEIETDALDEHGKHKEQSKELDISHPIGDSGNRRGKSCSNTNDSWKEVSQEGRLAFKALFSREVLPQSFSPPHALKNKEHQNEANEKDKDASKLDLNRKTWGISTSHQVVEKSTFFREKEEGEVGLLTMGLGHGKLKACRTGFKPYKRCSMEAKEIRVASAPSQDEEKCPKRLRLAGEAST
ncbi:unnamed protein product [Ilex paraguariensis]|uniref:Uncharacterized protein n=1 Tax=Ilex paraguariensis TaxID=185542 RepID=A0ABC8RF83_9AQUA